MRNEILLSDCIEGMRCLPDACIPMTLTSPPYDSIREYGGHEWSPTGFRAVAEELYRVTTPGGVVVWVVQDQVLDGRESGTFARQRVYFEEVGFGVYSTMIMVSNGFRLPQERRYVNQFQYAVVLSKGRPRSVTLLRDRPNSTAGESSKGKVRSRDGVLSLRRYSDRVVAEYGRRSNVWIYDVGWAKSTGDCYAFEHPAVMPERMAGDHIISWSKPGDLVFDPFMGSGTTCKMALLNHRHYLGFEVHRPYYQLALRRMQDAHTEYRRRLDDWLVSSPSPGKVFMRPPGGYEVVYADPPWPYKSWGRKTGGMHAEDHYRTMPMEEIMTLPVGDLAAKDSVLLLWTTGPFLPDAIRTIEAWGFEYKTVAFNWVKTRSGGVLHTGLGYHTRSNTELCLLATRGKGLPRVRKDIHQFISSSLTMHSAKPAEVRHRIEALYGPRRRVELFARTEAPGWHAMGNAIDGRDIRDAIGARSHGSRVQPLRLVQ